MFNVAVSIHSNLDLAQLLSKRPSGDSANPSKNSAKIGSDSDPQWNGVPQTDAMDPSAPAQSFSTALQDALAAALPSELSDAAQAPASTQPGKQTAKQPSSTSAVPSSPGNNSPPDLLTLLLSSQKVATPKQEKDSVDSKDVQQPPTPEASSPASALAYFAAATPVQSAPLVPVVVDPTAVKAEAANPIAPATPNSVTALTASAAAPGSPTESPNISAAAESIVFDGHVTAAPKQNAAPPAPAQTPSNPIPDAKLQAPVQMAAQQAQSAPAQPQSQAAQPRPPANANVSASSIDATPVPAVSNGNSAGNKSSFGQEMKQDGKSSSQNQVPVLPPTPHSTASANFPPQGAQNNLNGAQQTSASSNGDAQPIVNQPPSVQTNVKTDMNLKMQSQSGDNITVRLSERAGGIQVTVRSSDPTTSAMLRHELPNIQAGLEQAGLQLTGTSAQHAPQQHSNGNQSQGGDQGGNHQRSGNGAQEQQKRRNNAQHQWFEMMQ